MSDRYQRLVEDLLTPVGVTINGRNPWDIQVHDARFFRRTITEGELGVGESYMDGWWDAPSVDELVARVLRAHLEEQLRRNWPVVTSIALAKGLNLQAQRRAFIVGERHYDLGNELFVQMLDKRMNYSCAYWDGPSSLDEAQERKLDLICRKLQLQPSMRVLDLGCGWGAFGKFAAERYGATVVGVTVSKNQVELGMELCKDLPVEFQLKDYRDVTGSFDRVVSVGMIEHVGYRNYETFFDVAHRSLTEDGLFLLHTIGGNRSEVAISPWMDKYIFPNAVLPSIAQLGRSLEGLFVMEDWESFGHYYDRTLMTWHANVTGNWEKLKEKYDDRFFRMWTYYLLSCAGAFRARAIQVWQIVLSKSGVAGGYQAVRRA